jgi:hypothetical protein
LVHAQIKAVRERAREACAKGRSAPPLILEIDMGELLPVVIADDKADGLFID